jgi:hypothetical protein
VALWRKVPRCPDGGFAIDCSWFIFWQPIGAGSGLGKDVTRAVETRHGDSGCCGTRDGVARRKYVHVLGHHPW